MSNSLPNTNTSIAQKYDAKTLAKKVKNKTNLQESIGWPAESKTPMICLPMGMTDDLGGALFTELLPGLLSLPVQILVLGKGSEKYGKVFTKLAHDEKHRVHIITNKKENYISMLAAADMALFLEDPAGNTELTDCLHFGVVPISLESKALTEYDPIQESGSAFTFGKKTVWSAFACVVQALESFRFPYDWRTIQRHCMEEK